MKKRKILLIPDACFTNGSGAYVAQVCMSLLEELGHSVAFYTHEVLEDTVRPDGIIVYRKEKMMPLANILEKKYSKNFEEVLNIYNPDVIFTLGSVTNKPVCYWRIAHERKIKIVSMIFMQDFFCTNFYANDERGLCTKCLDGSFYNVFRGQCKPYKGKWLGNQIKKFIAANTRVRMRKELLKADALITSSRQQIDFYMRYGMQKNKCYITPLYFSGEKLKRYNNTRGDYFVFVAQNRIDKGVHLLKDVLSGCNDKVKVVAAYSTHTNVIEALSKYGLQKFVENGILEMRAECTWNTDLGELLAGCRGVLNLSIWPTTTEYVLLESLGLKKPIFTFNVGIHPEIIESGENGFVADTPSIMAAQLNLLAEDDSLYDRVSNGSFQLYQKLTDKEGWKDTLNNIFNNIFK